MLETLHQNRLIILKDPITSYNQVISQYNNKINIQNGIALKKIFNNFIYKRWFFIQSKYCILFLFYLVPYFNILILALNLIFFITNELAVLIAKNNKKKIDDPFKHMIYEPELCNRNGRIYQYFEVTPDEFRMLRLDSYTENKIISHSNKFAGNTIKFMAYTNSFISGFYLLKEYRLKAAAHFLFSFTIVLVTQNFIYYPLFCISVMQPIDSLRKCYPLAFSV